MMSRLEVPLVDAARIVEGQGWASIPGDGRHFLKIVPIEVCAHSDFIHVNPFEDGIDLTLTPTVLLHKY